MKNNKIKRETFYKYLLFFWTFVVFSLIFISVFTMIKSFTFEKEKTVNYSESSNINYKVYLKKNNFYENEYLEGNSIYVASLIDKININFDYVFEIEENTNLDFDYSIIAKLIVSDKTTKNNYYEKDYVLLETKKKKLDNDDNIVLKENVDIEYNYYNDIVNEFRSTYGLNIDSRLEVKMLVTKVNSDGLELASQDKNSDMSFVIPLSEKSVNIKMNYKDLKENSYVTKKSSVALTDKRLLAISCLCIAITIYSVIKWGIVLNNILKKKTRYQKFVNKILKEYDRLIVETSNLPEYSDYKVININGFLELVDVHDNLNLPIMYYSKKGENKAYFYISNQNTIYLYIVEGTKTGDIKYEKK